MLKLKKIKMGCACCANEVSKDSFLSKPKNHKSSKRQKKIQIDTINSINTINVNGLLNITYNDTNNKKENNNFKKMFNI